MVQFASLTTSIATVLLLSLGFNEVAAGKTCVVAKSKSDDAVTITQAFNNCKTGGTVYFPKGNTYYLKSMVSISGVKNVNVNFAGQLVLPPYDSKFKGKESYIEIKGDNIHWSGGGTITGNGQAWYDKQDHTAPTVLRIKATNSVFGNFKIYNAPRAHMALTSANNVVLENIYLHTVSSSKNPAKNTDALDVSSSSNIVFRNSELNVGDDCTAINGGVNNITLSHITCNGGHGFSVGSLGKGGKTEYVKTVRVLNSVCNNCQNGVRIKTWPGGKGAVQDVSYRNVELNNVENPIIITTHYCDKNQMSYCTKNKDTSLSISHVAFHNIHGSAANVNHPIVSIDCSSKAPCSYVTLDQINIKKASKTTKNVCNNVSNSKKISYCT
ncbi:hypothetical protein CU097_008268 [Rhizopus azygosporus]|uniref:Exopolygalacturonase rpg16 n=1 Tax=Rhizopus azygosporus TaxID=86630 RepID=A0A367JEA8_RHIAZ|nr:hypothetical protein CU097_008268 [Rhizopus azygosporus]